VIGFFLRFAATEQYNEIFRFDAYPLHWFYLGTIRCPLVQFYEMRLQHTNISEPSVAEMCQSGQDMGSRTGLVEVACYVVK
jgi:hypothetical protein